MVFKAKLDPGPGIVAKGRGKGRDYSPNRSTANAREAIAQFVEGNTPKFNKWLDEIYEAHGAKAAFECVSSLIEYHVPKLSRREITGEDEGPVEIVVSWQSEKP